MNNFNVLIVEDEAMIADHIASVLEDAGYSITAICDEADECLAILSENTPDVILLDINLNSDIDGIDLAHEIKSKYNVPIVFLTSNTDKKTIERAKRVNPLSFIAKPYTNEGLVSNLAIALHNYSSSENKAQNENTSSLLVKDKHRLVKVEYKDISYVQAMDNYVVLVVENKKYIMPHTLKKAEQDLVCFGFIRTHRSYLVNKNKITEVLPNAVKLKDIEIPLSNSYRQEVLTHFNLM